jgi:hypothetical protein
MKKAARARAMTMIQKRARLGFFFSWDVSGPSTLLGAERGGGCGASGSGTGAEGLAEGGIEDLGGGEAGDGSGFFVVGGTGLSTLLGAERGDGAGFFAGVSGAGFWAGPGPALGGAGADVEDLGGGCAADGAAGAGFSEKYASPWVILMPGSLGADVEDLGGGEAGDGDAGSSPWWVIWMPDPFSASGASFMCLLHISKLRPQRGQMGESSSCSRSHSGHFIGILYWNNYFMVI